MKEKSNSAKAEEQYANAAVENCNNSIYDGDMMVLFTQNWYDYGHSMMNFLINGDLKECEEGVKVDEYESFGQVIKDSVYKGVRIVNGFPIIEEDPVREEISKIFGVLAPHEMRSMVCKALYWFKEGAIDRSEEIC